MAANVFLYSLVAAAALFVSGGISSWLAPSKNMVSAFQHFAGGVVFAAVSVELLPFVLKSQLKLAIAVGFLIGLATMLAIRLLDRRTSSSLGMITAIGIDLFIDGILIGLAFVASKKVGFLILLALTIEALFLGLSLMPTFIRQNLSRSYRFFILTLLSLLISLGAVIGAAVISLMPKELFLAALSFGVAALLFLVTEELLVEAHQREDTLWGTSSFFIGFLLILCLH